MNQNNNEYPRAAVCCTGPISGGAGSVLAWATQALSSEYAVDLISFHIPDLLELDVYYGTHLQSLNINCSSPLRSKWLANILASGRMPATFKRHLFMKLIKQMDMSKYRLVFADFEANFGCHTLQYIYYPLSSAGDESSFKLGGFPDSHLRRLYRRYLSRWSGFDLNAMKKNTTIADSEYAASMYRRIYTCDNVSVVYPPVCVNFEYVAWKEKSDDFIAISRMVSGKRLEDSIDILKIVRLRTERDIKLHIVAGGAYDPTYRKHILNISAKLPWIKVYENISREELNKLVVRCRYGIHAMHGEHFGIAVAEMLQAGCIPFVSKTGGVVEIVGRQEDLMFGSKNEAIQKVIGIILNKEKQETVLKYLERQKPLFQTHTFCDKILVAASECAKLKS